MRFHRVPVQTISKRLDETIRFPSAGVLDSDYLIKDDQDQEAAKARVQGGVIVLFAIRSDLEPDDQTKTKDLLLRSIIMDADNSNANLSIEITPNGFDELELRRFFERFGFRRVSDTIMKRNAGSIHPASMAESWPHVIREAFEQAEATETIPYPFLDQHKRALEVLRQQAMLAATDHVKMRLRAMNELVPGHRFQFYNGESGQSLLMSPAIFHPGQRFDQFESGQDIEQRYNMCIQDGIHVPAGLLMVAPLADDVMNLYSHIKSHFGMGGEEEPKEESECKQESEKKA